MKIRHSWHTWPRLETLQGIDAPGATLAMALFLAWALSIITTIPALGQYVSGREEESARLSLPMMLCFGYRYTGDRRQITSKRDSL